MVSLKKNTLFSTEGDFSKKPDLQIILLFSLIMATTISNLVMRSQPLGYKCLQNDFSIVQCDLTRTQKDKLITLLKNLEKAENYDNDEGTWIQEEFEKLKTYVYYIYDSESTKKGHNITPILLLPIYYAETIIGHKKIPIKVFEPVETKEIVENFPTISLIPEQVYETTEDFDFEAVELLSPIVQIEEQKLVKAQITIPPKSNLVKKNISNHLVLSNLFKKDKYKYLVLDKIVKENIDKKVYIKNRIKFNNTIRHAYYQMEDLKEINRKNFTIKTKNVIKDLNKQLIVKKPKIQKPNKRKALYQIFNNTTDKINESLDQFVQIGNNIASNVSASSDHFIQTTQALTAAAYQLIETVGQKLNSAIDITFDVIPFLKRLFVAYLQFKMAKDHYKIHSLFLGVFSVISEYIPLTGYIKEQFETLFNQTKTYINDFRNKRTASMQIQTDFFNDFEPFIRPVSGLICVVLSWFILKRLPGKTDFETLFNRLGTLGRNFTGIKQFHHFFKECYEQTVDFIKYDLCGFVREDKAANFVDGLEKWMENVRNLTRRYGDFKQSDKIYYEPEFVIEVESLYNEHLELARKFDDLRIPSNERTGFMEHSKYLTSIFKETDNSGAFGNKPRTKPLTIWLTGESQIGKSGMTWPLSTDLNAIFCHTKEEAENFAKNIYYRNVETEFWDNYTNQNIVVYDDFGQMRDSPGKPNPEFMEIIRTGNVAPYPLHMAHLQDKRKTKFTSKVVIMTSNVKQQKIDSLTYPDAFRARIDVMASVKLKPEYRRYVKNEAKATKTRLDVDKALEDAPELEDGGKYAFNTNVYLIDILDGENPETIIKSDLSYDEFFNYCAKKAKAAFDISSKFNTSLIDYATKRFDKIKAKYQVAEEGEVFYDAEDPEKVTFKFEKFRDDPKFWDLVISQYKKHSGKIAFVNCMGNIVTDFFVDIPLANTFFTTMCYTQAVVDIVLLGKEANLYKLGKITIEYLRGFLSKAAQYVMEHPIQTLLGTMATLGAFFYLYEWGGNVKEPKHNKKRTTKYFKRVLDSIVITDYVFEHIPHVCIASKKETTQLLTPYFRYPYVQVFGNTKDEALVAEITSFCTLQKHRTGTRPIVFLTEADEREHFVFLYNNKFTMQRLNDVLIDIFAARKLKFDAEETKKILSGNFELEVAASADPVTQTPRTRILEVGNSGDVVTRTPVKHILEVGSSGDVITRTPVKYIAELGTSGDVITRAPVKHIMETDYREAEYQYWHDRTAHEIINNKILKNQYIMRLYKTGEQKHFANINITFVKGQVALCVSHVIAFLKQSERVSLENCFRVKFDDIPTKYIIDSDIPDAEGNSKDAIFLTFPREYVTCHSDLTNHFVTRLEMQKFTYTDAYLPVVRHVNSKQDFVVPFILQAKYAECLDRPTIIQDPNIKHESLLRTGIQYDAPTTFGDCGSILVLDNVGVPRKLFGVHMSYDMNARRALAEHVSQADIIRGLGQINVLYQISFQDEMMPNYQPFVFENVPVNEPLNIDELFGNKIPCEKFMPLGVCTKPVRMATKSGVLKSIIHGKVKEPVTAAARLTDFVNEEGLRVNILKKNLKKAAMDTPFIDPVIIDNAVQSIKPLIFKNDNRSDKGILTLEESVQGIEGDPTRQSIDRSTSPGYPWVLDRPQNSMGKQFWLGSDQNYKIDEELRRQVFERIDLAKKGIRKPCVWTDTLKDERRPLEKVAEGKTRVFANGPQDFTLTFRMYFLNFISHIMNNRIYNEQSLGTNCHGPDWTLTAKYLKRHGENVIAGDFSSFDGTLNSCILSRCCDLINEWYDDGEENALIRNVLFVDLFNSIHLNPKDNYFYMWTHSQPSGNPLTTVLNSLYNSISMRIVFTLCARDAGEFYNPYDFSRFCTMVSYGDDNVVNISQKIISWFNQETITKGYSKIGMIYTDEAKTGNATPLTRKLEEIAYLKRKFIYNPELRRYLAPLDIDVVLEMPNWVKDTLDKIDATQLNCEVAIEELSHHDRETFEYWSKKIIQAFRERTGNLLRTKTWDGYNEIRLMSHFN